MDSLDIGSDDELLRSGDDTADDADDLAAAGAMLLTVQPPHLDSLHNHARGFRCLAPVRQLRCGGMWRQGAQRHVHQALSSSADSSAAFRNDARRMIP
jgi:hypothetical protein